MREKVNRAWETGNILRFGLQQVKKNLKKHRAEHEERPLIKEMHFLKYSRNMRKPVIFQTITQKLSRILEYDDPQDPGDVTWQLSDWFDNDGEELS